MSTSISISSVIDLPSEDAGQTICRLHNGHIDGKKTGEKPFTRRQAVSIVNVKNGASVIRYVMGARSIAGLTMHACAIDYDARCSLGLRRDETPELVIKPASFKDIHLCYWGHHDLGIQLSYKLGFIGFCLGAFSAVLDLLQTIL
ncbi:MAG: hypothetical protein EOO52_12705 [Gammaproteobacteria bacterium]|nr:MAG: hypothetical protein EOO52_12705 [Gammaproteobacteria bacterium]